MKKYYLIAREKESNKFKILRLEDSWYLDEQQATGKITRNNDLEAIDLVTSNFSSCEELASRLYENGYIDNPNVDIFIASKRKKDGSSYIKFDEVVYGKKNSQRTEALRTIARNSLNGNMNTDKRATGTIYDDIIMLVYGSFDFCSMIMDGETNISRRMAEELARVPNYSDIPYELKYEKAFSFGNYREVRNVVEAMNRLERFSNCARENRVEKNQAYIEENYSDRLALVPELSLKLEPDYCDGQLSLFGFFDESDQTRIREATRILSREAKVQRPSHSVSKLKKRLSIPEMINEVFRVLETVPTNLFVREGNKFVINERAFDCPILDNEKYQLNHLMTGNLPKFFMNYAIHKEQLGYAESFGEYHEAAELRESCDRDKLAIKTRFKSSKCVADTYDWCMLYEKCKQRSEQFSSDKYSSESGKADAKIFGKK